MWYSAEVHELLCNGSQSHGSDGEDGLRVEEV